MPYRGSMTPATYYHSPYLGALVSRRNDSDAKPVIVKLAEVFVALSLHRYKISSSLLHLKPRRGKAMQKCRYQHCKQSPWWNNFLRNDDPDDRNQLNVLGRNNYFDGKCHLQNQFCLYVSRRYFTCRILFSQSELSVILIKSFSHF